MTHSGHSCPVVVVSRRLVAEGLGAAFLLAAIVTSGIVAERLSGENLGIALLSNSLATGAMLVVLISVFGPVSGAHLNPAVTLAFFIRRSVTTGTAAAYIVRQLSLGLSRQQSLPHGCFGCQTLSGAT